MAVNLEDTDAKKEKNILTEAGEQPKVNQITEGVIWKQLLIFFFPILFGTFFQQLYNAADAMIVGRYVGKVALSAVGGGTGTVIQVMVGLFVGLSSGATVIISQYYGAKRGEMVGYAVHTSIAFSLVTGVIMMIGGIIAAPAVLRAMDTPAEVLEPSVLYIRIYFIGIIGNLIYNMGSGILRAVGDSKRPLYFLIVSCLTNIALDVLLVVVFRMGVAGAAWATILSQALSAVMVLIVLMRTDDMYRLELRKVRFDGRMFRRIIQIGLPAGLQSIMYSSSNVIIQASVNALGTDTVAAWTAYSKIDAVYWMIVSAFGISVTTFVGQNYGAGKNDRVRKGVRDCMIMTALSTILISFLLYYFGIYFYRMFTSDVVVIDIGILMMRFMVPFYITYVSIEVLSGALRGVGDCWIPMLLSCGGICVIRFLWILFAVPLRPDITNIMFSYPLTWVITSTLFILYYLFFSRLKITRRKKQP